MGRIMGNFLHGGETRNTPKEPAPEARSARGIRRGRNIDGRRMDQIVGEEWWSSPVPRRKSRSESGAESRGGTGVEAGTGSALLRAPPLRIAASISDPPSERSTGAGRIPKDRGTGISQKYIVY